MKQISRAVYIFIIALILLPLGHWGLWDISAPFALFAGLVFAFAFPTQPCPKFNKKCSKYLLQVAVVCLGFNMNLQESLKSGADGMLFTVVSVVSVMCLGVLLGYYMHLNRKSAYLISSGTAIHFKIPGVPAMHKTAATTDTPVPQSSIVAVD